LTPPENRSQGYRDRGSGDGDGKVARGYASNNAAEMESKDSGQRHDLNWSGTNPENRFVWVISMSAIITSLSDLPDKALIY
jgi:hypothetical protein